MTAMRSEIIREVETDLSQARARAMLKTPKFAGRTYTEMKSERRRFKVQVYQALLIGIGVLSVVAIALKAWVG